MQRASFAGAEKALLKILHEQSKMSQTQGWLKAERWSKHLVWKFTLFQKDKKYKTFGIFLNNLHVFPFSLHAWEDEVIKTLSEESKKYPHCVPLLPSAS